MVSLIVADAWKNFPLVALIGLAALQAVPKDIKAAAVVDGAGAWSRFKFVLWPYLAGPLMVALVLRTIEAFKVFDIIWVMTRGGPANTTRSLSILVYQEAFSFQRAGSGASLALIVTLIITVLASLLHRRHPAKRGEGIDRWNAAALLASIAIHLAALFARRVRPGAARLAVPDEHLLAAGPQRPAASLVAQGHRFLALRHADAVAVNSTGRGLPRFAAQFAPRRDARVARGLVVAVPAGWAVSRHKQVGWSLYAVIATYMLPPVALAVPLYRGLACFGLLNTTYGLALVYLTILAPFTTWLLKSGFDSIPHEIENARP